MEAEAVDKDRRAYVWADGIYFGLRAEDERLYAVVVIRINEGGQKRCLVIEAECANRSKAGPICCAI